MRRRTTASASVAAVILTPNPNGGSMAWIVAAVYDRVMRAAEVACLIQWRQQLLQDVVGAVLEVGAGTGATLPLYPGTITRLVLAEPDPHMRRRLERKRGNTGVAHVELSEASLDALPMPDASFDAVVSSLVLCSVHDAPGALKEIFRVLKPGGRLLFLEHVAARSHSTRFAWQRRLEPLWKRVAGNCHLTRDTEAAIRTAGFQIERIERESMRRAIPFLRPCIRGAARKPVVAVT